MSTPQVNSSTVKGLNDSEMNEISTKELKRMMASMINKIKNDMFNHLRKFKRNKSIQLNELRKNFVRAHKEGVRIGKTPKKLASICCP
jgi:glutamyl-tRNA reductase